MVATGGGGVTKHHPQWEVGEVLTVKDVVLAIRKIREVSHDDEKAHAMEDDLREKVLTAVARGRVTGDKAREWAALALTTSDIEFARWGA